AQRQLWVTTRNFLPNIFLQRRYSRGKTIAEEYQAEDMWLKLYQPLYDGGRLSAFHRYHSFALEVAKLEYTKLKEELIYKIKLAYYEYISATLEVEEIEKMLSEIDSYYKKLENEFAAKAISELELQEGKIFKEKVENMCQKAKKNKILSENKLVALVGVKSLDEIIFPIPFDMLKSPPKEIDFELDGLKNLLFTNNIDLKVLILNMRMAKEKEKLALGKVYPKFYFEGTYGQSGEAFVTEPLELSTVWSGMLRLSWLFGGSSVESYYQKDKAIPREILDVSQRIDNTILDIKLGLFDDMKYFVEKKEADTLKVSTEADYEEAKNALLLELEKFYNEYYYSLLDVRIANSDLELKKWRFEVTKKRRDLYEISTIEVMNSIYQVSEAVLTYSKALLQNYTAVSELEKLVVIPLR
ncbi:MAG: TolC family protein, partial [Fervidobacterium sp.]